MGLKKEKKIKVVLNVFLKLLVVGITAYVFARCLIIEKKTEVTELDSGSLHFISGEKYHYAFDHIKVYETTRSNGKNWIYLQGWCVEEDQTTLFREFNIVLRDCETGKYYRLPTMMQVRKDVTGFMEGDLTYDQAGFECHLPLESLFHNEYYDYEIYFQISYDGNSVLLDSHRNLKDYLEEETEEEETEESTEEVDDEEVDDGE